MVKILELKLLVILSMLVQIFEAGNFEKFKKCLLENGVLPGTIVRRSTNSTIYNDLNFHWQLRPPKPRPLAYVVANLEDDVVTTVVCGTKYGIRVVARSGGHSFEKYSFGDIHSIVLDLRNLRTIVLNISAGEAVIGAGALTGPVMITLWNNGKLFFPVGTCLALGLSGLATGGGYGYLARNYGLTVDYIKSLRIVTADGRLRTANVATNSDLFWALRGGGDSSFGVVTSLAMKVIDAPPTLFTATVSWTLDSFSEVYEAWQSFTASDQHRTVTGKMTILPGQISIIFIDSTGVDSNFDQIQKSFPLAVSIIRNFHDYPNFVLGFAGNLNISGKPVVDPQDLLDLDRDSAGQSYTTTRSFYIEKIINGSDIGHFHDLLRQMPNSVSTTYQAYGGAINDVATNYSAFIHRRGRYALAKIQLKQHPGSKNSNSVLAGDTFLRKYFEFGAKFLDGKESYQNYVDGQLGDYLQKYYGSNLKQLVRVKKKYDPDNYFHNPQSIPTELPRGQRSNPKGQRST